MSTSTNKIKKGKSVKRINPEAREKEYPEDFKKVGNALMCIHCNHEVDWKKSSVLENHVKCQHHIEYKFGKKKHNPN